MDKSAWFFTRSQLAKAYDVSTMLAMTMHTLEDAILTLAKKEYDNLRLLVGALDDDPADTKTVIPSAETINAYSNRLLAYTNILNTRPSRLSKNGVRYLTEIEEKRLDLIRRADKQLAAA